MPPRSRKPTGPTAVEALTHADKRVNLPTADAAEAYGFEPEVTQVRYPRDPSLDPQLVWRGKDEQNSTDLVADAPPIYQQEKIDPRVLIQNLRRAVPADDEPSLFDSFDGLNEIDAVDFYHHQANWSNRMILGDSLQVMSSLAERESLRGQVQMIYMDPPYGIKFGSNWQASARKRDVKDGNIQDAVREAEQIKAFRDTWELGINSYLAYLRDRLVAARALLTESGSVFVQIGDENVHLVRNLMDEVMGPENFVSQLVLKTTTGAGSPSGGTVTIAGVNDYAIWYARDLEKVKYRQLYTPKDNERGGSLYRRVRLPDGAERPATEDELTGRLGLPEGARLFVPDNLTSQSSPESATFAVDIQGHRIAPQKGGWKTNVGGMKKLIEADRLYVTANRTLRYIRYFEDFPAMPLNNVWNDVSTGSFTDDKVYIVQTNSKIVLRCMLMCTDPGDLVLDPTCGSGTTAYVAEHWGRRWITIDTSRVALALARQRLMGAKFPYYYLADTAEGRVKEQSLTGKLQPADPVQNDIRQGFVYERVQHITLKSIANNPDIREGMSRAEIDAAIKRHAEFEVLYDKPYEDKSKVRVAGPFSVESLSPHRSLKFGGTDDPSHRETLSERDASTDSARPNYEQTIMTNLETSGIQNGRRGQRIEFATIESFAGVYLQAVGERRSDSEEDLPRIGIAIGPQYGTVSPGFIKAAVREAVKVGDIDLVCVCGFAFDSQATDVSEVDGVSVQPADTALSSMGERTIGRIKLLPVRMNMDLLMGENLKKTTTGNLFTVFGEPDIQITTESGQVVVELKGVDVYDPTIDDVRSDGTDRIALWMIDTEYNDEAFFVRHCYFTGGGDPYKRLKIALKAEIDAEAWASMYQTKSRPFERPASSRIAVKVINDYGDEVMKVFEV